MRKIINKLIVILLITIISVHYCFSKETLQENVEITYIANEGFLIKVNNKIILIDALFGETEFEFCDIPDSSSLELMKSAKEDFEHIDLIAATHCHIDHFNPSLLIAHLINNKLVKFISTGQSIGQVKEADNYNENLSAQLVEITPDTLTYCDTIINGIEVTVYRLIHGPYYVNDPETGKRINRHQNVQNLGFIFNINGIKIFHCGDSDPSCISDYKNFSLDKESIDIAFIGSGFMLSSDCEGLDIIRDYIKPKHIILMHIHHVHNKHFVDVAEQVKDEFPSVMVFEKQMKTKQYTLE